MKGKLFYGLVIGALVVVSGLFYQMDNPSPELTIDLRNQEDLPVPGDAAIEPPDIVVYVTGAVREPGIYEVPEGFRLHQVIDMAGGFTEEADDGYLNLARFIFDGEMIDVPYQRDGTSENGQQSSEAFSKISINRAGVEELMTLTGIGASKAEAIIDYRETNGPFQKIEDIMNVNGIKEAMYEKIKDDIVL